MILILSLVEPGLWCMSPTKQATRCRGESLFDNHHLHSGDFGWDFLQPSSPPAFGSVNT